MSPTFEHRVPDIPWDERFEKIPEGGAPREFLFPPITRTEPDWIHQAAEEIGRMLQDGFEYHPDRGAGIIRLAYEASKKEAQE